MPPVLATKKRAGPLLIERIFNQHSTSVAIALLKKDELKYEFYGGKQFASPRAHGGVTRTTRFNIGTASMCVTGALAVKLMEFGELRLSDHVRKFVPEFRNDDVTVYHLMTHTSGLRPAALAAPGNHSERQALFSRLYGDSRLTYATGAECQVAPAGYAALSDIIERVCGQPVEDLASTLLFMPLGMKRTTYGNAGLAAEQYVTPWSHAENRYLTELGGKLPIGHTGVYTTALDLIRFGSMLLNAGEFEGQQVFLESSVHFMLKEITGGQFMRTPVFMAKGDDDIYGCFSRLHSHRAVACTGDLGSMLFIDPLRSAVGVALTNSTWVGSANRNFCSICDILLAM